MQSLAAPWSLCQCLRTISVGPTPWSCEMEWWNAIFHKFVFHTSKFRFFLLFGETIEKPWKHTHEQNCLDFWKCEIFHTPLQQKEIYQSVRFQHCLHICSFTGLSRTWRSGSQIGIAFSCERSKATSASRAASIWDHCIGAWKLVTGHWQQGSDMTWSAGKKNGAQIVGKALPWQQGRICTWQRKPIANDTCCSSSLCLNMSCRIWLKDVQSHMERQLGRLCLTSLNFEPR